MNVSSVSQDNLAKLNLVLYGRPAGRNIVGFATEEILRLQAKIQQLQNEITRLAGCQFPTSQSIAVVEINGKKHATSQEIADYLAALLGGANKA